jgi:hypothetical protein
MKTNEKTLHKCVVFMRVIIYNRVTGLDKESMTVILS